MVFVYTCNNKVIQIYLEQIILVSPAVKTDAFITQPFIKTTKHIEKIRLGVLTKKRGFVN